MGSGGTNAKEMASAWWCAAAAAGARAATSALCFGDPRTRTRHEPRLCDDREMPAAVAPVGADDIQYRIRWCDAQKLRFSGGARAGTRHRGHRSRGRCSFSHLSLAIPSRFGDMHMHALAPLRAPPVAALGVRSSMPTMLSGPELIDAAVSFDTFAPQFLWLLIVAVPRSKITESVMGPILPLIALSLVHLAVVLTAATAPGGTEPIAIFADVFDPAQSQLDGMVRLFQVRDFVAEEWPVRARALNPRASVQEPRALPTVDASCARGSGAARPDLGPFRWPCDLARQPRARNAVHVERSPPDQWHRSSRHAALRAALPRDGAWSPDARLRATQRRVKLEIGYWTFVGVG